MLPRTSVYVFVTLEITNVVVDQFRAASTARRPRGLIRDLVSGAFIQSLERILSSSSCACRRRRHHIETTTKTKEHPRTSETSFARIIVSLSLWEQFSLSLWSSGVSLYA